MFREHQRTLVMLSGFWPLRGYRWEGSGWVNPFKKDNLWRKSFFQIMLNEVLKIYEKWMSVDVKANIKQQEVKDLVAYLRDRQQKTFRFLNRLCLLISNPLPPLINRQPWFFDPTLLFDTYISLSNSYLHYTYLYIYCLYTYTILILYLYTILLYCITL